MCDTEQELGEGDLARAQRRQAYLDAHAISIPTHVLPARSSPLTHACSDEEENEESDSQRQRGGGKRSREEEDEDELGEGQGGGGDEGEREEDTRLANTTLSAKFHAKSKKTVKNQKKGEEKEKKAPKRHKEGPLCMEQGRWRVTECPKKPVNAYMIWFLENRHDMKQEQEKQDEAMPAGQISRIASELWKAMPESVKDAYKRRSALVHILKSRK